MIGEWLDGLHPYGWTGRRSYRLACTAIGLVLGAAFLLATYRLVPEPAAVLLAIPLWIALTSLTVRRLRDAGLSTGWAGLMIVSVACLFLVPVLMGLLLPGRPLEERVI